MTAYEKIYQGPERYGTERRQFFKRIFTVSSVILLIIYENYILFDTESHEE